jgi:hypothetical protein
MKNTLTCVYCGEAYPEGTPPHGSKVLTDHIKTCESHPLRDAEKLIAKMRLALEILVGVSTREELEQMRDFMKIMSNDPRSKECLPAIEILLETLPK